MVPLPSPESLVFPRVVLEHDPTASSIAIVGLVHVMPRSLITMYQEVAEFAQSRLSLPNSVVHYELHQSPTEQEALDFEQTRPTTYEKIVRIEDLQKKWLKLLGLVHQTEALYDPYVTDGWKNHDLRQVDWAHQVDDDELDDEIAELEEYCDEVHDLDEQEREEYYQHNYILDALETAEESELPPFDRLREEFAVKMAIEELQGGMEHVTLLWGLGHMASMQAAFAAHGYRPSEAHQNHK
jgi:hypothetical protein